MQQIFSGHLLYARCCVRKWRINKEQNYRYNPSHQGNFKLVGKRMHYQKKQYSYQLVTLAVEMGGKRSAERFMELKVFSHGIWFIEALGAFPKK